MFISIMVTNFDFKKFEKDAQEKWKKANAFK